MADPPSRGRLGPSAGHRGLGPVGLGLGAAGAAACWRWRRRARRGGSPPWSPPPSSVDHAAGQACPPVRHTSTC